MRRVRFGIIGCGVIAPSHAKAIIASDNAELVSVCDIIREKAQAFASEYNVEKVYTDYIDMLKDPEVEVVNICTPSGIHGEIAIKAAEYKKNIFCEKPMEITKEKMDAIISAVRNHGVKMGCVFQKRTESVPIAVKEALSQKKLGDIILFDTYLKYYRSQEYYNSADWRGTWELDGGGALMNQGVHGIDLMLWMCGGAESVFARTAAQARDIEVEDTAIVSIRFKNGAFGILEGTTSVFPGQESRFEIHGKKGSIIFADSGIKLWKIQGSNEEAPAVETESISVKDDPRALSNLSHYVLIKDMADAVLNDREPMIPPEEARHAVDFILAVYESSKTGKEIFI